MFHYIWAGMILFSIIVSFFTGRVEAVAAAATAGAQGAVMLSLELIGIVALWNGLMNIANASGLIGKLSRVLRQVYRLCFPHISPESKAGQNILLNVTANVLGLGNAATPFGLKAMQELGRDAKGTATNEMVLFLVLNTASIQLIPTTVATVRAAAGCEAPFDILPAVWLASALSVGVGILACKIFSRVWRD